MTGRTRTAPEPAGEFTWVDGEEFYRISAYHRLPPFLMSITNDADLWMFISSGGGLTAGRIDAEGSLFPYETVDKLHDAHHHTGPVTLLRVQRPTGRDVLWEPFSERAPEEFRGERNLYKTPLGNQVLFEEINHELDLVFRSRWSGSDEFGLVRTATLTNRSSRPVAVVVLDGLRNILPYGVPLALYQQASCLVDAYKRSDCDPGTRLGIFSLTTQIIDRAEAAEELRANTVWGHGLPAFEVALSAGAIAAFRRGEPVAPEHCLTGRRGNYLAVAPLELPAGAQAKWHLAADTGRSHVQIAALRLRLHEPANLGREIEASLMDASRNLLRNASSADGVQLTGHREAAVHHLANVVFNNMRGGIFAHHYDIPAADFTASVRTRNRLVADRNVAFFAALPAEIPRPDLVAAAERTQDAGLERLCYEYLPIHFGRRHGDPSRPWNRFAIQIRNPDGSRALRYEGNWRDIFQNWEALALSFPGFLPSLIAKFVNASTADGFNPYRITHDGVDWEVADPDDPWSYIGYWGDHQIIYLLKFLEASSRYSPGGLETLLQREIFCYADVPYRLKPYEDMLQNPHSTIVYDTGLAARIAARVDAIGTDGKLLPGRDGAVYHVNLLEKLLVPALSKLSNLIPDAGIWMNTQRPEWNDANNALVGNGISMVTLCYLRRYLAFLGGLVTGLGAAPAPVSSEVVTWLRQLHAVLDANRTMLTAETLQDGDRKRVMDALGQAFSAYRATVYAQGFSGKEALPAAEIGALCRVALDVLDHAIRANQRADGLYHSYNLLQMAPDRSTVAIRPLYEMLEGQVAVLSSGVVGPVDALQVLASLFRSRMYRADQHSFLLYPERELPGFLERNAIPDASVRAVPLLRELIDAKEQSILVRDAFGVYRFHAGFRNALDVAAALDLLAAQAPWAEGVARDRPAVLEVFEAVFAHHAFTGRSGSMYGYEGLGCIYWHMVSKLLLAVQEIALRALHEAQPAAVTDALVQNYYRIRAGLGFEKTVREYGAFPTDPYSHTPSHAGAQQPGMTGQVKEDILARFGELGIQVENGVVAFRPALLRRAEFLQEPGTYQFYDRSGEFRAIDVPAGALAFSFCQVPIVYTLTQETVRIRVTTADGKSSARTGNRLDAGLSRALFDRLGRITRIDVGVHASALCRF